VASINDHGQIAGAGSTRLPNSLPQQAAIWSNGTINYLSPPTAGGTGGTSSIAVGINNSGQLAVQVYGAPQTGYFYNGETYTPLYFADAATYGRSFYSNVDGINNAGQVVGGANVLVQSGSSPVFEEHAFIYSGGVMVDLGTFGEYSGPGTGYSEA